MSMTHYEHLNEPLATRARFLKRLWSNGQIALWLIGLSLFAGMAGYHGLERLSWIDSFVNAAMILSGMGPMATMATFGGKLFAGLYALYSGLLLIFVSGLLLAPVAHRLLHRLHVKDEG